MMKIYLVAVLMFFACSGSHGQSLSFLELQSLTNMTDDQVHNYLLVSKGFRSIGMKVLNGKNFELFRSNRVDPDKTETVSLRVGIRGTSGNVSRQVIYFTLREQDISSLLAQARHSTMSLVFQGSDPYKNIYRFDNSLFMAIISTGLNNRSGSVVLEEK